MLQIQCFLMLHFKRQYWCLGFLASNWAYRVILAKADCYIRDWTWFNTLAWGKVTFCQILCLVMQYSAVTFCEAKC